MLGLQGEAVALPVDHAARADQRPVEEVPRIELDAGLRGADVESTPAARIDDSRGMLQPIVGSASAIEHPVVIVPQAVAVERTGRQRFDEHVRASGELLQALASLSRLEIDDDAPLADVVVPEVETTVRVGDVVMEGREAAGRRACRRLDLHHVGPHAGEQTSAVLALLVDDLEDP